MDALIDNGEIKQIIVVTDAGHGLETGAIEAAKKAYDAGITVSAIGINNPQSNSEKGVQVVKGIAESGGGLWEYSFIEDLSKTMQDLTLKTAGRTIKQAVGRQLKAVIGDEIEDLEPKSKTKITDFINNYGENINLRCIVVFDVGESMGDNPVIMKKSVIEMFEGLRRRKGKSSIAVIFCTAENSGVYSTACDFTSEVYTLGQELEMIYPDGDISSGSPILKACELMHRYYEV